MTTLFTLPKQVPVNSSGTPYPGAKLYFYAAGTTTAQLVYSDVDLTTAHAQPVVADALGRFPAIYLNPNAAANYRVQLKTLSNVLVYDQDDIPKTGVTQSAVGAALWPQTDAERAAGVTPTNYYYEPGNVKRYGATGDGVTNDTTAIQAAISSAESGSFEGSRVYFPAGTYLVSDGALTYGTSATGIVFYGDGPTSSTIKLATSGTSQVYLYNNSGAQSYRNTYRDLRFLGADAAYCNAFKLNDSAGWEKQFKFYNCRFETINTVLTTTGTTNADICLFDGCEWITVTTLLNVNNSQSMLHNFIGCRGTVTGDVWVIGASGGGEFHYIGGNLDHLAASSDKYLINGSAGPAVSVQTGNYSFNNVRFEHRSQYAKLVYWPAADASNRGRQIAISFNDCNLATASQSSGTTRTNAVLIGEGKSVTFRDCTLPLTASGALDDFGFTITADNTGAPSVPHGGVITFDGCSVQKGLHTKCTVTNRYGVFHAINCVANDQTDASDRAVVNFSKGMLTAVGGSAYAAVKTLQMLRYGWPYSDGAAGFLSEYTATLPVGAILLRATIYKPAQGIQSATVEYHIGTSDKVTSYVTTTTGRSDALHAATAQINVAPLAADTTIRLWMSETTPSSGTLQQTGGYAFVEYI